MFACYCKRVHLVLYSIITRHFIAERAAATHEDVYQCYTKSNQFVECEYWS